MTDCPLVLRTDVEGVTTLTLNRPESRNALSGAMLHALNQALIVIAADTAVRVVVLAGAGPVFCAGHDLKELRAAATETATVEALFATCAEVMQRIVMLPKPVIARVQGMATAAGCQLVASCDLAIAAEDAHFATPGVTIGLFCSTPMVALSRAIGPKQAMRMLLTGEPIDAATALQFGLVSDLAPPADLEAQCEALARLLASKSPLTLAIGKGAFQRQREMGLAEAYAYTSGLMARNLASADAQEGIAAFLEKRSPVWCGR